MHGNTVGPPSHREDITSTPASVQRGGAVAGTQTSASADSALQFQKYPIACVVIYSRMRHVNSVGCVRVCVCVCVCCSLGVVSYHLTFPNQEPTKDATEMHQKKKNLMKMHTRGFVISTEG